jgi:hypothetical protein
LFSHVKGARHDIRESLGDLSGRMAIGLRPEEVVVEAGVVKEYNEFGRRLHECRCSGDVECTQILAGEVLGMVEVRRRWK